MMPPCCLRPLPLEDHPMIEKTDEQLNTRSRTLLKKLIHSYIDTGQPVGSRTLARDKEVDLSPATVRNVMADLEDLGFLASPHTSAGRIPTAQGYRFFVDSLLRVEPLAMQETSHLEAQLLAAQRSEQDVFNQASTLLSDITHFAGVVMLPRHASQQLRHVEFLPLSERRVLVIFVFNQQDVQNKIIHTQRDYSASELQEAANYLNQSFVGKDISQVLQGLKKSLDLARNEVNQWLNTALEVVDQSYSQVPPTDDCVIAGETNLMDVAELSSIDTLRDLFAAFNQKRDILELLEQSIDADGVQIFIGEESGHPILDECSIITAPYQVDNNVLGVLGVIGPTRMAYDRVIPVVDITARLLSATLKAAS